MSPEKDSEWPNYRFRVGSWWNLIAGLGPTCRPIVSALRPQMVASPAASTSLQHAELGGLIWRRRAKCVSIRPGRQLKNADTRVGDRCWWRGGAWIDRGWNGPHDSSLFSERPYVCPALDAERAMPDFHVHDFFFQIDRPFIRCFLIELDGCGKCTLQKTAKLSGIHRPMVGFVRQTTFQDGSRWCHCCIVWEPNSSIVVGGCTDEVCEGSRQ